jgi:hypothetical protein
MTRSEQLSALELVRELWEKNMELSVNTAAIFENPRENLKRILEKKIL